MSLPEPHKPRTRREALALAAGALVLLVRPALGAMRPRQRVTHPEPREGITAEHVLDPASVPESIRDAYRAAQEIPEILDGLFCHCDCAERDNLRSLLSCYETRMPISCSICSGEARLARRLRREGGNLASIRKAIDRRFG